MGPTVEPWLRGTHREMPALQRAVIHALELAGEDLERWCAPLTLEQVHRELPNIPSVAFQLRHIAGSVDRLLTYAEGNQLSEAQMERLQAESVAIGSAVEILGEVDQTLKEALGRVRAFRADEMENPRDVGRKKLPTTVGGLLVHVAEHTQRHVGQAITTAKLIAG
jgi:uncharacterized damage-inducible protein DinB